MSRLEDDKIILLVADTRTRVGAEAIFGGESLAGVINATRALLAKRPATAQALANAMQRSLEWLQRATPEPVADLVPAECLGGDRTFYMQAFAKFRDALEPPLQSR